MGRKSAYSNEFKQSVVEFYKSNTMEDTAKKFSIARSTAAYFVKLSGYKKGYSKIPVGFKHHACQYYDNHTADETVAKFGISLPSLFVWRRELGYRNKSRGYNLYTEQLQPSVTKRERRNFAVTRKQNGDLQAQIVSLNHQLDELYTQIEQLKRDTEIVQSIRNLFNH
jgi:transposase-like protein